MEEKKTIVIAEDYAILRAGLRVVLSSVPELDIVGEAEDGQEAIQLVEERRPNLVLMEVSMPKINGIDAIRTIKQKSPETKILVLTVHTSDEYVLASFEAGANGYVLKHSNSTELIEAIRTVLHDKQYISPKISGRVIEKYPGSQQLKPRSCWNSLTPREREVLKLTAEGYKNRESAKILGIAPKTVEKHRSNLMDKLDLHDVPSLTALAVEKGLLANKSIIFETERKVQRSQPRDYLKRGLRTLKTKKKLRKMPSLNKIS
jgi:two-component system, NarL family, response regulator NreC